jgi:hypothetical protein
LIESSQRICSSDIEFPSIFFSKRFGYKKQSEKTVQERNSGSSKKWNSTPKFTQNTT